MPICRGPDRPHASPRSRFGPAPFPGLVASRGGDAGNLTLIDAVAKGHRFKANFPRLLLHTAAYNLLNALRDHDLVPEALGNAQPATWRTRLIKVAATVSQSCRRIVLTLAGRWPVIDLYHAVARRAHLIPGVPKLPDNPACVMGERRRSAPTAAASTSNHAESPAKTHLAPTKLM